MARNGTEGLRCFANGRFHVAVTDVGMPGPDGWEIARQLRLAKPFTLQQLTAIVERLVTRVA